MGRRSASVSPSSVSTGGVSITRATNQMSTLERSAKGGKQSRGDTVFGDEAKYLV